MTALDYGQRHILRLAVRDADVDGWAKVSRTIWPFVVKIPEPLRELREADEGGFVRITKEGRAVLEFGEPWP